MKTIKEPKKNIAILWRRPQSKEVRYRSMKFLLQAQVDDGLLLYNVVTSEMVLLDDAERKAFESLPAEYNPEMDEMIARHYLVTEDFDECKSVRELRALIKKLEPSKRVDGFTILPTTECNARCYYCFESDFKRCTMTEKIASDAVNYMISMCKSEPLQICWFGGEPLVGRKRIAQICEELRQNKIRFTSTMVSNAYLFDEELIGIANSDWNLTNVQITLDGTEEIYNETKAYVNPRDNPYKRVLRNIETLLDKGITVTIRFNVTDKNAADLSILIDELSERFSGKKGIGCYSHAVYDGVGFEPIVYDDRHREMIDRKVIDLDSQLREKGLLGSLSRLPYLRIINCMSDNDSCRLIFPDGTIGKCENKSSLESIGDIYHDITDEDMNNRFQATQSFSICENCFLFPYCLNLKICPETGKCSRVKMEWKKNRYTGIMKEQYIRNRQTETIDLMTNVSVDDTVQVECES